MLRKTICFGTIVIYLGLVLIAFFLKIDSLLFFLAIPWSMPLAIISNLVFHMFSDGELILKLGMLIGTIFNSLIFLKISQPFKLSDDKNSRNRNY